MNARVLSIAGAVCALGLGIAGAQSNVGNPSTPFQGHQLTGHADAHARLLEARAAALPHAYQDTAPMVLGGGPEKVNTGGTRRFTFQGHDLTLGPAPEAVAKILYAPSEADDPAYRAAISVAAGGATVDYFDTRVATPSVATLLQYDCVHTWANFAYFDNVGFGNNLAAYNDAGGEVVLGVFCTYTVGNFLSGAIMGPAYCPVVSPSGTNHFSSSTYSGGGTTCLYGGVTSLTSFYRDFLVTQGTGVADGFYGDAEICHAYRPNPGGGKGDVVYSNGGAGLPLGGTGQWAQALANACGCAVGGPSVKILYAPSESDDAAFRAALSAAAGGATVDYFDARNATPSVSLLSTYSCVMTWANFAYFDNVGFGNNLATFVDNGGDVVLGAFCTYTSGNFLSGAIMTPAYCPVVSPSGTNHFSSDTYTGGGCTCLYSGVTTLSSIYRDFLTPQGGGIVDGRFAGDKEIAMAFRPHPGGSVGDVVYANGAGGAPLGTTGQYAQAIVNACICDVGQSGPTATCTARFGILGLNPFDYTCGTPPRVGKTWTANVSTTPLLGTSTATTFVTIGFGGPTQGIGVFGFELLILPNFLQTTALGTHSIPVPPEACFLGVGLTSQAARVEVSGPNFFVVLTNAQDLVLGM